MSDLNRRQGGTKEKFEATKKSGKFEIMENRVPI